ncbi:GH18132 [Drosophila grimshawi]|uniref:GH18132 n=1 Tax=Drosophila grimshawi TaxID=7222 RepID=B4JGL6_DROGR|nr:GH18132 [Drosophila grimshawi]
MDMRPSVQHLHSVQLQPSWEYESAEQELIINLIDTFAPVDYECITASPLRIDMTPTHPANNIPGAMGSLPLRLRLRQRLQFELQLADQVEGASASVAKLRVVVSAVVNLLWQEFMD